jgi:hypothetical protein
MAVTEELLVGALVPGTCQAVSERLVLEQAADSTAERVEIMGIVDEESLLAVGDLIDDAADPAGDDGPALPHRLGDRQAEALGETLLSDDAGVTLKRVNNHRVSIGVVHRHAREVDAGTQGLGQIEPGAHAVVEHWAGFGVVVDAVDRGPDKREVGVAIGEVLREAAEHARHVLDSVPTRNLHHQWCLRRWWWTRLENFGWPVDPPGRAIAPGERHVRSVATSADQPDVLQDAPHRVVVEGLVLRRERIDRGRDDVQSLAVDPARCELGAAEHVGVDVLDVRPHELPPRGGERIRRVATYVTAPHHGGTGCPRGASKTGSLWIVQDDDVAGCQRRQPSRIGSHHFVVPVVLGGPQRAAVAIRPVQPIVDALRDLEEPAVSIDDDPLRVDAHPARICQEGLQELRDASTTRRRVHIQDAPSREQLLRPCRGLLEPLGTLRPDERFETLGSDCLNLDVTHVPSERIVGEAGTRARSAG